MKSADLAATGRDNPSRSAAIVTSSADDGVQINKGAKVETADIMGTNGVIHAVDSVIMPANIVTLAAAHPELEDLVTAVTALTFSEDDMGNVTTIGEALGNPMGQFTVFAPTNDAFDAYIGSQDFIANLDGLIASPVAANFVKYHAISGMAPVMSADLAAGQFVTTLHDDGLAATVSKDENGVVKVNGLATVTTADIKGTNGVIHVVDEFIRTATIAGLASAHPDFSILVDALGEADQPTHSQHDEHAGYVHGFRSGKQCFRHYLIDPNDMLTVVADVLGLDTLANILSYHVVSGTVLAGDLMTGDVASLHG